MTDSTRASKIISQKDTDCIEKEGEKKKREEKIREERMR